MENGVERVDGSPAVEKNHVEDEVVGERVVEVKDVDGSDERKDFEDDVSEEALDSQEVVQMQGMNPDSENIAESVVDSGGPVVVDENSNVGRETETFEEAIGVSVEEVAAAGVGMEIVEDLVGGLSADGAVVSDKIDKGGTGKEVTVDGLNVKSELPEAATDSTTEVSETSYEVGMKSSVVLEDPKIVDSCDSSFEENPYGETFQNGDSNMTKENAVDYFQTTESIGEILATDAKTELPEAATDSTTEVFETSYEVGMKSSVVPEDPKIVDSCDYSLEENPYGENFQNGDSSMKKENAVYYFQKTESIREISAADAKGENLKDNNFDTDHLGTVTRKLVDISTGTCIVLRADKGEEVNSNVAGIDTKCQDDKNRELKDITTGICSKGQDEGEHGNVRNGEVNDAPTVLDSEKLGETCGVSDAPIHPVPSVKNVTLTTNVQSLTSENSAIEKNEKIHAVSSDLSGDDGNSSQPHVTDEKVNEVSLRYLLSKKAIRKVTKDQVEKQRAQVSTKREIQPEAELASSSGKSSSPVPPPARPAGLGRAAPLLEPVPRAVQQPRVNGAVAPVQARQIEDGANGEGELYDETREKLQMIRVKFLRLAHRLGQTPHNVVVAQVLYRLGLAEQLRGRNGGRVGAFSFDRASAMAEQLDAAGQEPLDFSCTILVLGKTGVGKSATINSIFDEVMFGTDAFHNGTRRVQDVVGTVQGIKVRVIDTPGLLPSWSDQRQNEKILNSVKRFIKKNPPDIVLYLDRLDMQSRDFGDMPLLCTITEIFGPSIWFNAIVVLTHAASAPPDGPNGTASSYDMFVTQRSHVVQQAIRQAAGDMRLMNPVALVENHSACRTNRAGQRVLPNGQVWKPHLLLLSFASKILAEANALLKLQDSPPAKPFVPRSRAPPLPYFLSSLLQSRPQVKLPEEQFSDEDDQDDDLDESSDSDDESYDNLPPFKRLSKAQVSKLTKAQSRAYFDELKYREKLFMKKQLKEERRRKKMMKKMSAAAKDMPGDYSESVEESGSPASVPVPMPDLALPASFDSDNPMHRYRCLDSNNQWVVRPVLETLGWDHDVGYEGINVERLFVVKDKIPLSLSGQVTKDKKDANVQMELASSIKHGEGKVSSLGFDMQTIEKDLAYTLRGETRFLNFRKNTAKGGLSVTLLGDVLSGGVKVEDKLAVNKRFNIVMTGGAMTGRGDVAYGGSLEAQLRDKDYPLGRSLSTLGLSVMDWHGDQAVRCNIQSQIPVGRSTNLIARANLNNKGEGQLSIRLNSSEQLQIALFGLIPLLKKLLGYSQQRQFGQ
ncbi:translocase of chloroplast [Tripterygium wilfordii]|uniref:Translocase of chloroplast n=1 Tax=Tripterygium wilfordii TaxID=458696 RepID=A0A7J7E0Q7_TRIWF|nr:translocase of chloroplast 120, chloroplastic-like [Tripterygium wilfordii]XP_038721833.1 translocase of chloroplast 120, chloroplastic-like [Tripterygium wilfordii]KAF5752024.1 translocase of chloroplast [Tripterygium wilfordii]